MLLNRKKKFFFIDFGSCFSPYSNTIFFLLLFEILRLIEKRINGWIFFFLVLFFPPQFISFLDSWLQLQNDWLLITPIESVCVCVCVFRYRIVWEILIAFLSFFCTIFNEWMHRSVCRPWKKNCQEFVKMVLS